MRNLFSASLIFLFLIYSCNTAGVSGSPSDTIDKFFDALSKKDVTTAKKYATADSDMMLSLLAMGMKMAPDSLKNSKIDKSRLKFGEAVINGDLATIPVTDKKSGDMTNFTLKKESGVWKVAFDMGTMMQMGSNKMKQKGFSQEKIDTIMDKMKGVIESHPELQNALKDSIK